MRMLHTLITAILLPAMLAGSFALHAAWPEHYSYAYPETAGYGALDEELALGFYNREQSLDRVDADDAEEITLGRDGASGPILKAGSSTFAEALAQIYKAGDGRYELTPDSRFYIASTGTPSEELLATVKLMDSLFAEYGLPTTEPLPVVYGRYNRADPGDIVICQVDEDGFNPGIKTADIGQSYRLSITDGRIELTACAADGIYYGMITLMEMAKEHQKEKIPGGRIALPGCIIADGPDYEQRVISLDCGRKYFSKDWIENLIRRSSLQRYNAIVLHFSEAEGFRLDSEVFPWLTKGIDSLSREDAAEIVQLARQYHMEVIPSLDTPGHNRYIVEKYASYVSRHPDFSFTYGGKTYDKSVKGFASIANHYQRNGEKRSSDGIGIDITKEHAVAFMNALIDDYAGFFRDLGCTDFDICADEIIGWDSFPLGGSTMSYENRWSFLEHWAKYARNELGIKKGSASDTFISYLNDVTERLEGMGYTCRLFNDDIDINDDQHVELRDSVEITYWNAHDNSARHFAKKGHKVYFCISMWCYYVLRTENGGDIMDGKYKSVNAKNIWNNWEPESFASKTGRNKTVPDGSHGGGYFCIWCDYPDHKSAKTVWKETELRTWANAGRLWNREVNSESSGILDRVSYKAMKKFAEGMDGFPGYTGDPGKSIDLISPAVPGEGETEGEMVMDFLGL